MGEPKNNVSINFRVAKGVGGLTSGTGTTSDAGYASTTVQLTNHSSDVQVTACVAPNNIAKPLLCSRPPRRAGHWKVSEDQFRSFPLVNRFSRWCCASRMGRLLRIR
jgi:hypothetical protein